MSETMPSHHSSDNPGSQWMMKQLKDLSGAIVSMQSKLDSELKHLSGAVSSLKTETKELSGTVSSLKTETKELSGAVSSLKTETKELSGTVVLLRTKLDTELKHLPTRKEVSALETDMAAIKERTTHLTTKADVKHLYGISSVIAVAAISIAIKLIFFGGI